MNPTAWFIGIVITAIAAFSAMQRADDVAPSPPSPSAEPSKIPHRVVIHRDERVPAVFTGEVAADGSPITVACGTCHATKAPDPKTARSADLDLFHQGLEMRHGELACLACHDEKHYDGLKLANGESIPFADRQRVCIQCHGPTARDYEHGAHGGMTGHWDLTRGERFRLGCTDCHDPHAPKFPAMRRTFFTHDRGAPSQHDAGTREETRHER